MDKYNWVLVKDVDWSYMGWSKSDSMPKTADGFTWISWDGEVPENQDGYNDLTDLYIFDLKNKTLVKKTTV